MKQIDRIELIYYTPLRDKGKSKFRLYWVDYCRWRAETVAWAREW